MMQIVKKSFGKDDDIEDQFIPPLLYRQVATRIVYDENLNIISDSSHETNDLYRQKAYSKECLKECLEKYNNYKNNKKLYYSCKMFKRMAENKLPLEIILEIINYLF